MAVNYPSLSSNISVLISEYSTQSLDTAINTLWYSTFITPILSGVFLKNKNNPTYYNAHLNCTHTKCCFVTSLILWVLLFQRSELKWLLNENFRLNSQPQLWKGVDYQRKSIEHVHVCGSKQKCIWSVTRCLHIKTIWIIIQ